MSRSDGSSAGAAQSVRLEVVGVIRDGGSADVGVIGVRSFGAVGEYTNTGAAAENTGVFGLGLLLAFFLTSCSIGYSFRRPICQISTQRS